MMVRESTKMRLTGLALVASLLGVIEDLIILLNMIREYIQKISTNCIEMLCHIVLSKIGKIILTKTTVLVRSNILFQLILHLSNNQGS